MDKPTVLVDVDDVLVELVEAWTERLNDEYKTAVLSADITEWDVEKFYPGLTKEQVYGPLHDPAFWDAVEAAPGAPEELEKMCAEFDVWMCSSTYVGIVSEKYERALRRLFPFFDPAKIIIAQKKQMIRADYLVDDFPENLYGGEYQRILVTRPHNVAIPDSELATRDVFRVSGLRDAYDLICELEKIKVLSAEEYDVCEKIARRTKMDVWFAVKQTEGGVDNVADMEFGGLVPLARGIEWLCEGVDDRDVFASLNLSDAEAGTFARLLKRSGLAPVGA